MKYALIFSVLTAVPAHASGLQDNQINISEAPFQKKVARTCDFALECLEAEACAATTFQARLTGASGGMDASDLVIGAALETDAETIEMLGFLRDQVIYLHGAPLGAQHILTVTPENDARYSVHYASGPMAVSYHGACKEMN